MKGRLFFPIRMKIMVSLLFVVTAVVSVITFTMANLFHQDKRAYINDLTSVVALNAAQECHGLLVGYRERLQAYARIIGRKQMPQADKAELLKGFFEDFPALVALTMYDEGEEIASVFDAHSLDRAGLTRRDLTDYRRDHPLPFESISSGELFVENSTLVPELPVLTLAVPYTAGGEASRSIISALVRLDDLFTLTSRSGVFEVFITEASGALLAHSDMARVAGRESIVLQPELAAIGSDHSAGITLEFERGDVEIIGGFAAVRLGGLVAVAEIPKAAAFLASRDLLSRLLLAALALLVVAALAGLFWSRRITRPIEQLSHATRRIARGEFDVRIAVDSHDEIGTLATSFNQMATELSERENALHDAQVQLIQSEKLAAVGQLGAGIAHEVKNPLAGILGCAQLSLRGTEEGTPLRKNLLLIEKETRRCKTIIENLMKFSRQDQARLEPTDINQVVDDAIAIVHHQLELQQVKVEKHLGANLPRIQGCANQLQQVLMNLLINAQHAMDGDPGTVTISTSLAAPESIEIRVADTGPGIPEAIRKKLFEPFFTTKPTGQGTGLGLSVSYGIIKDHGGEIYPESAPGRGATFVIALPVNHQRESVDLPEAKTA